MANTIAIMDTSIFLEILKIPNRSDSYNDCIEELNKKVQEKEKIVLPIATIIETGNHIAHISDGNLRRKCKLKYIDIIKKAINKEFIFVIYNIEDYYLYLNNIINKFAEYNDLDIGIGDVSIILTWEKIKEKFSTYNIYIWSKDKHLSGYRCGPDFFS